MSHTPGPWTVQPPAVIGAWPEGREYMELAYLREEADSDEIQPWDASSLTRAKAARWREARAELRSSPEALDGRGGAPVEDVTNTASPTSGFTPDASETALKPMSRSMAEMTTESLADELEATAQALASEGADLRLQGLARHYGAILLGLHDRLRALEAK